MCSYLKRKYTNFIYKSLDNYDETKSECPKEKKIWVMWWQGEINIGKNTEIGINTVIYSNRKVSIGNNALIAANCYIIDSNHSICKNEII